MKNTQQNINRKSLLIGLALSAVLCTLAFIASSLIYKKVVISKATDKIEQLAEETKSTVAAGGEYAGTIDYSLQQYEYNVEELKMPALSLRFVTDTEGTVSDSHLKSHLTVKRQISGSDKREITRYICHPDVNEQADLKMDEYFDLADAFRKNDMAGKYYCFCTSAYLDGKYFYPRLSLVKNNKGSYDILESHDFFPADTSGMEYVELDKQSLVLLYLPQSGYYVDQPDEIDSALGSKLDNYVKKNSDVSSIKTNSVEYSDGAFMYSYPVSWTDAQGAQRHVALFGSVSAALYLPVVIGSVVLVFAGTMFFVYRFAKKKITRAEQ